VSDFLMLDRQRPIVRGHFPVVLPRDWVNRFFRPLIEHSGSVGKFSVVFDIGHLILRVRKLSNRLNAIRSRYCG
jgi:hypothetical protein